MFALLNESENSVDRLNNKLTTATTESAAAVGEGACRKERAKLTKIRKALIAKPNNMNMSIAVDQLELAELSELINRSKTNDIRAYNMAVIEDTLQIGGSRKATKRKLAIGKDGMYALRDELGNIKLNMAKISAHSVAKHKQNSYS